MKRRGLLLLALIIPALVFARGAVQPSSEAGGYLRFAWWGNPTRDERTIAVARLFEQKNPGVTVETETAGFDAYWLMLGSQAAAGNLPDVIQQDLSYIVQYNDRNQLVDMGPLVQQGIIDLSQWSESALASGRLNNRLIAIPLGTNTWGLGADRGTLQRAGVTIDDTTWTWKEYESYALQIFQRTGVQTMPIVNSMEFMYVFENIVRQFGVPFFAADGKSLGFANNAQARAAIKDVMDMQLRLKAAGALYDPQDAAILGRGMPEYPHAQGKTWNNFHWSNQHIGHQNAAGRPYDYFIFPSVNGNKSPYGAYLRPAMFISMVSSSRNQELAAKYVNFFLNDLEANRLLLAERGIPLPANVRNDLAARVDGDNKYLFDFITKIMPFTSPIDPPYPSAAGEFQDVAGQLLLQCLEGRITSDAFITQMIQTASTILNR